MIHLDTSFLIQALARGSSPDRRLREWLGAGEPVRISAVGWAEFLCGPLQPADLALAARVVSQPVPFVDDDSVRTAELFNLGGRRRGSLLDCMIAAVALRTDADLATANPSNFRRYEQAGLRLLTV